MYLNDFQALQLAAVLASAAAGKAGDKEAIVKHMFELAEEVKKQAQPSNPPPASANVE